MDIKAIDQAVRSPAIHILRDAVSTRTPPAEALLRILETVTPAFVGHLLSLRLHLNPYYSLEVLAAMPTTVLLRQKFDFAASHRLNIPTLTPEENLKAFGKCNHPSGHGHNYVIEPCVRINTDAPFSLQDLEPLVQHALIDRYDHTHLTVDFPEFDPARGGVNSSVENISRVFYETLAPHIARAGATLASITVWETERTSAQYPAQ